MENVASSSKVVCNNDNEQCSKNLDILNAYIQRQRELLRRIDSGLSVLRELEESAPRDTVSTLDRISQISVGLADRDEEEVLEKLDTLVGDVFTEHDGTFADALSWEAFRSQDPAPLNDLALSIRLSRCPTVFPSFPVSGQQSVSSSSKQAKTPRLPCPRIYPRPQESQLHTFVRQQRERLVEPVLMQHKVFLATLPPDSDDERARSPENGRHKGDANAAAAIRPRGPGGLFVKRAAAHPTKPAISKRELAFAAGEDWETISRTKRIRRPSTRALAAEAISVASSSRVKTSRDVSSLRRSSRSCSIASTNNKDAVRLTIRIPPLAGRYINRGFPSSSSMTGSASVSTPAENSLRMTEERRSFSPTSTDFTQPLTESVIIGNGSVKLEEEESSMSELTDPENGEFFDAVDDGIFDEDHYSEDNFNSRRSQSLRQPSVLGSTNGKGKAISKHKSNGRGGSYSRTDAHPDSVEPPGKRRKISKSATFNQSWSVAEQHQLERLLNEIPNGEKNRWAQISKAMGSRTPRQVASRVQKYFNKLQKYGVNVEA